MDPRECNGTTRRVAGALCLSVLLLLIAMPVIYYGLSQVNCWFL